MRTLVLVAAVALSCARQLPATTLQQLSMDDMIRKSTAVVHGTVQQTGVELRGRIVYTHYRVKVQEQWKGQAAGQFDVAVPGGVVQGIRQAYAGAPVPRNGAEYVLFLWTSPKGLTQIIGLSQGLLSVTALNGESVVSRAPASVALVNSSGAAVADAGLSLRLSDLRLKVLAGDK